MVLQDNDYNDDADVGSAQNPPHNPAPDEAVQRAVILDCPLDRSKYAHFPCKMKMVSKPD